MSLASTMMRQVYKLLIPAAIMVACLILLRDRLDGFDSGTLAAQWAAIPVQNWVAALILTALSFWAIGRYDIVAHRHIGSGISDHHAARSGMAAIGLSQTLGLGLLTGSFARWRLLPSLSLGQAAALTGFVTATFLGAMAVITSAVCLLLPAPAQSTLPAIAVLASALGAIVMLLRKPTLRLFGKTVRMPSLLALGATTVWAFVDLLTAGAALYVLMPAGAVPEFAVFFPVFLLAFGTAIMLGTPGGVGPFELTLLALLHNGAVETSVITGVVAFRLLYYALPATLGLICLLLPARRPTPRAATMAQSSAPLPRAESGVIRQNGGFVRSYGRIQAAIWQTAQARVALFDPSLPPPPAFFAKLQRDAREANRLAVLYKCDGRSAAAARRAGWACLHLADDALIAPETFTLASSRHRQLRRKVRQAEKADISVRPAHPEDMPALAQVDLAWQQHHGAARGGTMGRFCPTYLSGQRVFVAEQGDRIVAFASFHTGRVEWALDLMRQTAAAPAGTMHKLVLYAIEAAAKEAIPQLSLSAVPVCPRADLPWMQRLYAPVLRRGNAAGLHQFKAAFAPSWQRLYVAAPSYTELTLALADIAHEVHDPAPLDGMTAETSKTIHNYDDDYEIASAMPR